MTPATQPESAFYPAENDDVWLRHIIEGKAVRATHPRVTINYLTKKLERVPGRPWEGEISGRMLSKANDIAARALSEAAAAASESIKFRHLIYARVSEVRKQANFDVYAEPKVEDAAHANLVAKKMRLIPLTQVSLDVVC